jgi:sugar-specific transcriptional regulator TrmB
VEKRAAPRSSYGPAERHLLETTASRIYSTAVAHGSLSPDDPRLTEGSELRPALDLLCDIGLLRREDGLLFPVDPSAIQAQVVVPLGARGAELISESARWADTFSDLGQVYRSSPHAPASAITGLSGLENINSFIDAAVNDSRQELLTAQPHGRRPATALAEAENRDVKALDRGVKMRTLYQHSARQSPATRDYVADIVARGAEVRTLDEFFRRLIVIDRAVAIVPASDNHQAAIAIHDTSLIAYLVDVFERAWERGQPFTVGGGPAERHIAADVRAMTVRLLVEGHSDPASAKRLGVSTRTYAGYIAALKEEYGVQTRFQLGHAMGAEPRIPQARRADDFEGGVGSERAPGDAIG